MVTSTAIRLLFCTSALVPSTSTDPRSNSSTEVTPLDIPADEAVNANEYAVWRCYNYATGAVSAHPETDPMPHIPLEKYWLDTSRRVRRYRAYLSRKTSWRAAVAWGSAYPLRAPMHLRENDLIRCALTGNDEFNQYARWYALSVDQQLVCVRRLSFEIVSTVRSEPGEELIAPCGAGSAWPVGFVDEPASRCLFRVAGNLTDRKARKTKSRHLSGDLLPENVNRPANYLYSLDQSGYWDEHDDVAASQASTSPGGDRVLLFRWADSDQYELEMRSADLRTVLWCETRRLRTPDDSRVIDLGWSEDGKLACVWSLRDNVATSSLTCFEAATGEYLRRVTLPFSAADGPWMIELAEREPDLHERFGVDVLEP